MTAGDQKPKRADLEDRRLQLEESRLEAEKDMHAADQSAKKIEEEAKRRQDTFDRRYKLLELKERQADRALKRQELEVAQGGGIRFTSAQATVAGALLALLSAGIGGAFQAWVTRDVEAGKIQGQLATEDLKARANIDLEREKFGFSKQQETQKEQHEIILKMISVGDVKQARTNLEFLAEAGLINDKAIADRVLKAKATPVLPTPTAYNSTREGLRCDTGQAVASKSGTIELDNSPLYVESCVVPVAGGSHGYYGYVVRLENRGSKILQVSWKAAGVFSWLPPGEVYTSTRVVSASPQVQNTEIFAGLNSKAMVEAVLPSESQK